MNAVSPSTPTCPYCYGRLHPTMTVPPRYEPATTRDCTIGFLLGLAVILFIDVGIFVSRDPTITGFVSNIVVAVVLTTLLLLWYWRMRGEVNGQNREAYHAWQKQMETWKHEYRCDRCALSFRR